MSLARFKSYGETVGRGWRGECVFGCVEGVRCWRCQLSLVPNRPHGHLRPGHGLDGVATEEVNHASTRPVVSHNASRVPAAWQRCWLLEEPPLPAWTGCLGCSDWSFSASGESRRVHPSISAPRQASAFGYLGLSLQGSFWWSA